MRLLSPGAEARVVRFDLLMGVVDAVFQHVLAALSRYTPRPS